MTLSGSLFFLSVDGGGGLKQEVKAIFSKEIVQSCIMRLIRN